MFPSAYATRIEEEKPPAGFMSPEEAWGERWISATSSTARAYMQVAASKQSLVCLAADKPTMAELTELINAVGPHIAALKTHVDLVNDWSPEAWKVFCEQATAMELLIFEDRKFADIGGISRHQMGGIYAIGAWSDLVTAHLISGPDIVDGLTIAATEKAKARLSRKCRGSGNDHNDSTASTASTNSTASTASMNSTQDSTEDSTNSTSSTSSTARHLTTITATAVPPCSFPCSCRTRLRASIRH